MIEDEDEDKDEDEAGSNNDGRGVTTKWTGTCEFAR
jgi:hypothetical protein